MLLIKFFMTKIIFKLKKSTKTVFFRAKIEYKSLKNGCEAYFRINVKIFPSNPHKINVFSIKPNRIVISFRSKMEHQ